MKKKTTREIPCEECRQPLGETYYRLGYGENTKRFCTERCRTRYVKRTGDGPEALKDMFRF